MNRKREKGGRKDFYFLQNPSWGKIVCFITLAVLMFQSLCVLYITTHRVIQLDVYLFYLNFFLANSHL